MMFEYLQWALVVGSSMLLFFISPWAKTPEEFFRGSNKQVEPKMWLLTSSLVISWIFAKSITNAANLGQLFGMVGGVAYAVYYLSFAVAGSVIFQMRAAGGFSSIHSFLQDRFGTAAVVIFSLLIGFRLFNEVWSNTMVIGSYFGAPATRSYYLSVLVFTGLTLAYTLKGGLRSSLITDLIQMLLFGLLLVVVLTFVLPKKNFDVSAFIGTGSWTFSGGLNLFFVAMIQIFSYPFHDPVLTDRAFISDPKTTRKSFYLATIIGFVCIVLFSFVGIFAQMEGLSGDAPVEVSRLLGVGLMLTMNFIMVTSAASTLDSAFNSFSKLVVSDLFGGRWRTLRWGRVVMVAMAILGSIPVFLGADVLSATTISGTMVIGLAPVFLFWKFKAPPLSFYLPIGIGIFFGLMLAVGKTPDFLLFTDGKYNDLLGVNLVGSLLCFLGFSVPMLFQKKYLK